MTNYSRNDKTISDKISKKQERSYNDNKIVIPLGLLIRETTQRILPYPPCSLHLLYPADLPIELDPPFHSAFS